MNKILQEILELLWGKGCDPKATLLLSNLVETLTLALSGNMDNVQRVQVESLSQFPTTTNQLIDRIRLAIQDSDCTVKVKSELQSLLNRFVELLNEYRSGH